MTDIPSTVKAYLATDDAFVRAQLLQQHPGLEQQLHAPQTRAAILAFLQNDTAWSPSSMPLTLNCIEFLRNGASEAEAASLRPFLLHEDRRVRLAAYEYLRVLYYPDKNREAMNQLYQNMLMDNEDTVRVQAIRYLKQTGAREDLRTFLQRWYKTAPGHDWDKSESYELMKRLLKD